MLTPRGRVDLPMDRPIYGMIARSPADRTIDQLTTPEFAHARVRRALAAE